MFARILPISAFAALVATGCAAHRAPPGHGERDHLERRQSEFLAAVAARDATAAAEHFAEDAVLQVAQMPPIQGRPAIGRFFENMFAFLVESRAIPDALRVSEAADMAYGTGTTFNTFRGSEGPPQQHAGKYLLVWRRVAAEWRIAAYSVSSDEPQHRATTDRRSSSLNGPTIDMHLHAGRGTSSQDWNGVLAGLEANQVAVSMLSVSDTASMREYASARFLLGPAFPCHEGRFPMTGRCFDEWNGWPDVEWLRAEHEAGRLDWLGELLYVYYGIEPTDERLAPYWELAEELDLPVGVHTGRGPPRRPEGCCPNFDDDLGNPLLLEPILERHPGLRLWLMHAPGFDYVEEAIALMRAYPSVYAEMSIMNSVAPDAAHEAALRTVVEAGLADRIMLGSDNMPLDRIIERLKGIPFLSEEQVRGILYGNAARFLRLDNGESASPESSPRTLSGPGTPAGPTGAQRLGSPGAVMQTVRSKDGTRIAFWRSGSGPPLLLVHGATADHTTTWRFVREELERRFTVYAMDRRGRGGSGDSPEYDLRREAEDVAAVVDAIGGPVDVVGHSYGALCALEAALLSSNVRRLVLYEGVPLRGADLYDPGVVDRLEALVETGDMEGTLVALFREVVEASPEDIEALRSQEDAWAVRLRNVPTMPRELRTEQGYAFEPYRFRSMEAPTLLLVGGESPPREMENARGVAAALPDARVSVLPGQQHTAMYAAPDLFVDAVTRFLEAVSE